MKTKQHSLASMLGTWPLVLATVMASGCNGSDPKPNSDDVALIILQEGQTANDVIGANDDDQGEDNNDVTLTDDPANAGIALFSNPDNNEQNIAGFEFCCGGFGTYEAHGFTQISGDFTQLDGGWWGADVAGHLGERVFSSFGDGFTQSGDSLGWIGFASTGEMDSPAFTISARYINFLVGGGSNGFTAPNTTAVVLVVDGDIVRQASGDDTPMSLNWVSWDVNEFAGKTATIRFIDHHPDDNSDTALPYLLVDEMRMADEAAVAPTASSLLQASVTKSLNPLEDGVPAFSRESDPGQNIAGFEFCCGHYNTYANHDFRVTGDFAKLDGGWWAADVTNHVGERAFSSRSDGFLADDTGLGWIGNNAMGTLSSPPFTISHKYINFLVGGGTNPYGMDKATAVVLRVNGKVVRKASGNGEENKLDWVSWDVSALAGQQAVVEIIDNDDTDTEDALAFIMVDEIKQSDYAAADPSKADIVSEATGHSVGLPLVMADPNPFYYNGQFYIYYLIDTAYHDWYLSRTENLTEGSFPQRVLSATGNTNTQDQWTGSGSVVIDQEGNGHIFYSGHNADFTPVEAVMHAVATDSTLTQWEKVPADTFSGSAGYSDFDFRDPKVFWNADDERYWMLVTTRYNGQAAIGLYTSANLLNWEAQSPLYTQNTPLNMEVADWVTLNNSHYLLFSDQNDGERDVKYLQQNGESWEPGNYQALDGELFYAGRTAQSDDNTLLFGWVAHKNTRSNAGTADFGGDLAIHELIENTSGELAVIMPSLVARKLDTEMSTAFVSQSGAVSGNDPVTLGADSAVMLAAVAQQNRLHFSVSGTAAGRFGLVLTSADENEQTARIELDTTANMASFYFGDTPPTGGASVTPTPALEGQPLFVRDADTSQNIAGFEFCCGQYDTYQNHGFSNATGDFIKLDGGWWGGDVANNVGERVFSSFGDGFEEDGTALGWIGFAATGTLDSPSFEISKPYINFMIGGGANAWDAANATAVVLIVDDEVVRSQSGADTPKDANDKFVMQWATWDVSDLIGKTATVRFIDEHADDSSDAHLPYLLADQFRAADLPAVIEGETTTPSSLDAQVNVPMEITSGVNIDVVLYPQADYGVAYINNFRALSFRLYGIGEREIGLFSRDTTIEVTDLNRFSSAP